MIKVSVIVPVYNAAPYLRRCLDTLLGQTLEEIEIIAINDGSTDASGEILEEYRRRAPEKLTVLQKENGGQASARNLGLRRATGEYIGYVDADDYADPELFERLYETAAATDADLTVCDHYKVKNGKKHLETFRDYPDLRMLFVDALVSPWNKLLRREVLLESGVVFPEGYIYEDTAWFVELIPYLRRMANVHRPLLFHVVQKNSTMTAAQGERTAQIFPVLDGVLAFYRDRGLFDDYRDELEYFYARILLLSSLRRIAKIRDRALRREYADRSLRAVREQFPDYRRNRYLRGWRGWYLRNVSARTLRLAVGLAAILG